MTTMSATREASGRGRRRGLRELALTAAVYLAYEISRVIVQGRRSSAFGNAARLLRLERISGIAWERTVNGLVSAHQVLAVSADYMYATLHYLVTPLVLVWLWRRHRAAYPRARSTLMLATLIGLVTITLLPVAPPRMLPGFVDTMADYAQFGWWDTDASAPRGVEGVTNEIAAMPSLHVGWALWCGWQLARHARRRLVRLLGALYPVATSVVVIGTANHYVLDVLGGVAVIGIAATATLAVTAAVARRRRPRAIDLTALPAQHDPSRAGPVAATADSTAAESVVIPVAPRARS
ncbi:MAG: phosphatase PAP2 family protein [Frankiaceae bacterium]